MPSAHFSNVSFAYAKATPILVDASFDLGPGWAGLVGANGAGKSTVLGLLTGDLHPDRGVVRREPADGVVLCRQRVDELTADVEAFAADWDGETSRLRSRLGLDPGDLARWPTLSPGERKRWQVGAALAVEPPLLLLDEPTNHLDTEARDLLLTVLERYRGCGVVVSHDRTMLDRLTTRTIRLASATLSVWGSSYGTAKEAWEQQRATLEAERSRVKATRKAVRQELAAQRQSAAEKDARRINERRTAGIHDLDTRGAVATGRHASGQAAGARRQATTRSKLEGLDERLASSGLGKELGGEVRIRSRPAPKEFVARVDGPVRAGDMPLFEADLAIRRTDRLRLAGRNGSGKTSLLRAIADGSTIPAGRVLHLPQEATSEDVGGWMATLRALPSDERGDVLSIVATLGSDPARLLSTGMPSPGEARKLAMALGLGTERWLLLLDEPTNHLDLPSIERLETALAASRAALVLITHDDALAGAVTAGTIDVDRVGDADAPS
jgi:ATPase subunit of ABC transporter with duplicated ATPase domains